MPSGNTAQKATVSVTNLQTVLKQMKYAKILSTNLSLKSKLSFHIPPEVGTFSLRRPLSNPARAQLTNAQDVHL